MSERLIMRPDSFYVVRDNPLYHVVEKARKLHGQEKLLAYAEGIDKPMEVGAKVTCKDKLPAELFKRMLGTMNHYPNMETCYMLYFNAVTSEWHIKIPDQQGSGASVSFVDRGLDGVPKGFYCVGHVHTHPEMSAFWSGTDHRCMDGTDSLNIVFGLSGGKALRSLASIFTAEDNVFDIDVKDVIDYDGVDVNAAYEPDPEWVKKIDAQKVALEEFTKLELQPPKAPAIKLPAMPGMSYGWNFGSYCKYADRDFSGWLTDEAVTCSAVDSRASCNSAVDSKSFYRELLRHAVDGLQDAIIDSGTASFGDVDKEISEAVAEAYDACGLDSDCLLAAALQLVQERYGRRSGDEIADLIDEMNAGAGDPDIPDTEKRARFFHDDPEGDIF